MADCINNVYKKIDAQATDSDLVVPADAVIKENVSGLDFEGMKTIDTLTNDANIQITPGSFKDHDKETTGTFKYDTTRNKMENNWKHTAGNGTDVFEMKLTCKNLAMAYKLANAATQGTAKVYVDGKQLTKMLIESSSFEKEEYVSQLEGNRSGGYNNAWVAVLISGETVAKEHTIRVEMVDASKNFTILAFGYNQ